MTTRLRPLLTVSVDAHIKRGLERRKKEESLNVSAFVNAALLPHFPAKKIKQRTKK
jgi:hypothetical protein